MEDYQKIKSFTDLSVWQEGHKLVLLIYKETKKFPQYEQFGIASQMQRAVVLTTSNVAEGFSRRSYKEKVRFCSIAHGSLTELENQLLVSRDVGYVIPEDFNRIMEQAFVVHRLLNKFISKTKELS